MKNACENLSEMNIMMCGKCVGVECGIIVSDEGWKFVVNDDDAIHPTTIRVQYFVCRLISEQYNNISTHSPGTLLLGQCCIVVVVWLFNVCNHLNMVKNLMIVVTSLIEKPCCGLKWTHAGSNQSNSEGRCDQLCKIKLNPFVLFSGNRKTLSLFYITSATY